ncbi:MAG: hypothetical protein H7Y10_07605 [Flavobacterium sp.]|nr:hypothetical protein [Flavobacterium sp.]
MKLPTLNRIIERIINSAADGLRTLRDVFEAEDNIFTQDYRETRKPKYPNKNILDSRATSIEKTVILEMMKESEPYWL